MQHLKLHASSRNELPPKDGWALPQRFRDRDTVQWIFWYWMTGFLCFRESIPLNMLFYFVSCMNRRCIWFIINNIKCLNFVHLPQRHSASCWNNLHEYCVISQYSWWNSLFPSILFLASGVTLTHFVLTQVICV